MSIDESDAWMAKYYLNLLDRVKDQIEAYYAKIKADTPLDAIVSHQYSYNKYMELYAKISEELNALGITEIEGLERRFIELYDSTSLLVSKHFGTTFMADKEAVRETVNKVWCQDGKIWSMRVWEHLGSLQQRLMTSLSDAIVAGVSVDKLTENIMYEFNVGYHNACRLARTEMAHIYNTASVDRYKDAGAEYYQWVAAAGDKPVQSRITIGGKSYYRDIKVCEQCEELDGQIFPITDTEHIPPNFTHPNCRCAIVPILNKN